MIRTPVFPVHLSRQNAGTGGPDTPNHGDVVAVGFAPSNAKKS
jgi:hypothetical protein